MEYYSIKKIEDGITAIRSKSGEIMYLIEGTKEAVLIDTCIGLGNLRELVEGLTKKPVTVLISHGHIDHAMGAPEFETVYMNKKDIPLYQSQCSIAERRSYAGMGIGPAAAQIADTEFVPVAPEFPFRELEEGMTFDLGGIQIDAYEYPGHTKGCMIFLIREKRILVLGDACNNSTFLFDEICSTVEEYQNRTRQVEQKLRGTYDRVFLMHHIMEAPVSILTDMLAVCDDILAGRADNLPFEFMGKPALIAKTCNEYRQRADGGFANLIYDPNKCR